MIRPPKNCVFGAARGGVSPYLDISSQPLSEVEGMALRLMGGTPMLRDLGHEVIENGLEVLELAIA